VWWDVPVAGDLDRNFAFAFVAHRNQHRAVSGRCAARRAHDMREESWESRGISTHSLTGKTQTIVAPRPIDMRVQPFELQSALPVPTAITRTFVATHDMDVSAATWRHPSRACSTRRLTSSLPRARLVRSHRCAHPELAPALRKAA